MDRSLQTSRAGPFICRREQRSVQVVLTVAGIFLGAAGASMSANEPNGAGLLSRGRLVASGGGPGGPATACFNCHGINGEGQAASGFPRLAGLDHLYQAKQLDDYASGARSDDIMSPIARQLSEEDRQAVSVYYSWASGDGAVPPAPVRDPALLQQGAALYARGSAERGLQACANCHGPTAQGLHRTYPALAGQHASYTTAQLRAWRDGTRSNDPGNIMAFIARQLTEHESDGVAAYLAHLKPVAGRPLDLSQPLPSKPQQPSEQPK